MEKRKISRNEKNEAGGLIRGRILVRNTVWNIIGLGAPILVALFAIPLFIKGLGTDRFGVLTLAWAVVGYFSLFDLGLGRAMTKLVAEKLGTDQAEDLPGLVWTGLMIMGLFSLLGAVLVAGITPWLVHRVIKIPQALQDETLKAFYLLALSIPVVISTIGFRAVLEAYQRFDLANMVRIPLGVLLFLSPLAVMPFSNSLFHMVAVMVACIVLASGVFLMMCLYLVPALRKDVRPRRSMVRPLMSFGGWMTVTNIVGPMMTYLDRFLIGALISVTAVAYYATPYEVVTKLWLIPSALVGVLFPAFSTTLARDRDLTARLFGRGVNYTFLALFPLTLIIVTMAYEGLTLWLGVKFADNSAFVLQWLAAGVFVNGIARVPFALVQGAGRPDLTAKMHLIELPVYLLVLWCLIRSYGIEGVAVVWVVRVCIDTLVLFAMVRRILPGTGTLLRKSLLRVVVAGCFFIVAGCLTGLVLKGVLLVGVLLGFSAMAWARLLEPEERELIKGFSIGGKRGDMNDGPG